MRDANPYSPTFGQTSTRARTDLSRCPLPVRYLTRRPSVSTATRATCPAGQAGSVETFMVPAGDPRFFSFASAGAAEALADQYVAANVQAYADAYGTCYTAGGAGGTVQWRPVYGPEGCFACQMANAADPSQVRDATSTEAAQYATAGFADANGNYQPCLSCP